MKNLLLFGALALCLNSYGQSKKEQIAALNYSMDSLNVVLSITRNKAVKDIGGLNTTIEGLNTTIEDLSKEISDLKRDLSELESSVSTLKKDKILLTRENEKFKTDLEEISKKNLVLEAKLKATEIEKEIVKKTFTYMTNNLPNWWDDVDGYRISLNDDRVNDEVQWIGARLTPNDAIFFIDGEEIKFISKQIEQKESILKLKFISGGFTIVLEYDENFITGAYTEGIISLVFDGQEQVKTKFIMTGWGF
jgi:chromosome segregation ATPase